MRQELDEQLCKDFPKIFADRNGSPTKTLMCFGFEHGDGWYDILRALCSNIQYHIDWVNDSRTRLLKDNPHGLTIRDEVQQVVAVQIKEKFGTLRFYYNGGDDYIRGLVTMAESMSCVTCEECGNSGRIRHGGWIRTLCDTHAEAAGYNMEDENDGQD
jgi:hypothetical protein